MTHALSPAEALITTLPVRVEQDVVEVRQQSRAIAEFAGFEKQDQIRIATALSELVRNVIQYAGKGQVLVEADIQATHTGLIFTIQDSGPGIPNLDEILDGRYVSRTGMGKGLLGTKLLMDYFWIESLPGKGTIIKIGKRLPRRFQPLTSAKVTEVRSRLKSIITQNPMQELQRQNQEQLQTLQELRDRQEELVSLNLELEATNRGVVALYAELDERATYLSKVSDLKTRFLSNMSHEFRTPLNSIRTLTGMLLDQLDGPLFPEQEKQITYIRHAAEELSALVDDLLDLAKAEAGRLTVRNTPFDVASLFNILRGLLKPLTNGSSVTLHFDEPTEQIVLFTDEGKVSQILRNFISNAIKFTAAGEVRVGVKKRLDCITFSVSDTGCGISPENLEIVFEEFSQIENPMQSKVKGTGLGLPLSRKLAEILGGRAWAESTLSKGSTFYLELPEAAIYDHYSDNLPQVDSSRKVLVIDDDDISRYVLQSQLERIGHEVVHAANGLEGLDQAAVVHPDAIFLDLNMPGISGYETLDRLKASPVTASIPVVINTSMDLTTDDISSLRERGAASVISKGPSYEKNAVASLKRLFLPSSHGDRFGSSNED